MIYFNRAKTAAFTLIESMFIIVIISILFSLAIPYFKQDKKQEAAMHILSYIRYTQYLALIDNMHEHNSTTWQRKFWKIMFAKCKNGDAFFRIGSDTNMRSTSTFKKIEAAIDTSNGKPLYMSNNAKCTNTSVSSHIFIGKNFGVRVHPGRARSGCARKKHIGFDHLGRPHVSFSTSKLPNYASYMKKACIFTFTMPDDSNFSISILPQTGYAQIIK
jgi:type II secretory pathway pseudopilin PulG